MRLLVVAPLEIIDLFAAVDFFRELSPGITTIDSAPYVFLGDDIMSIAHLFEDFLKKYVRERTTYDFPGNNNIQKYFEDLKKEFEALPSVVSNSRIKIKWGMGKGNWAKVPWIAFLDERETDSTQHGSMSGFAESAGTAANNRSAIAPMIPETIFISRPSRSLPLGLVVGTKERSPMSVRFAAPSG